MNELGSTLALLSGAMLLKLRLSGGYLAYVKQSMGIWIVLAGALLVTLGAVGLIGFFFPGADVDADEGDEGDHDHEHRSPRVAALLVVPILAVFLVDPAPLGSYAAGRQQARTPERPELGVGGSLYDALPPPRDGAVDIAMSDYVSRALYDPQGALGDARLRVVGIVTDIGSEATGGFRLTRFKLACCAADAYPVQVDVVDVPAATVTKDSWAEVEGTFAPGTSDGRIPHLRAISVRTVPEPDEPYE